MSFKALFLRTLGLSKNGGSHVMGRCHKTDRRCAHKLRYHAPKQTQQRKSERNQQSYRLKRRLLIQRWRAAAAAAVNAGRAAAEAARALLRAQQRVKGVAAAGGADVWAAAARTAGHVRVGDAAPQRLLQLQLLLRLPL